MPSRVLAFVGDDPGQKGATCLLGVLDDPSDTRNGEVVYCAVWDHALRKTDRGEHVDPVHFAEQVRRHALAANAGGAGAVPEDGWQLVVARVVIEVPRVGGRMFSADGVVTQGANYGIILAASLCSSEFRAEVVEDADPAGGQWYAEAGADCPKGKDRKEHSVHTAHALLAAWSANAGFRVDITREGPNAWGLIREDKTTDRADALLLAHLGVLRWLGRAVVPATGGAAVTAKARTKSARDYEVVRAVEGVDAKALKVAVVDRIGCPKCVVRAGEWCYGKSTCRERVWAMAAGMKAPGLLAAQQSADLAAFLKAMRDAPLGAAISCAQGVWRRMHNDLRGARLTRAALDAAIDAGMVRLTLDAKRRPVWVTTFREAPTLASC